MTRTLHAVTAVLAVAALLVAVAGGCLCAMPPAAAGTHDCCEGSGGAVLAASHDCCLSRTTAGAPVLVVAASDGLSPQAAVLGSPWLDLPAVPLTPPRAVPTSAAPSILRI